jgi:predicted membrane channel-forming protein YqfA (hemolysin III family)
MNLPPIVFVSNIIMLGIGIISIFLSAFFAKKKDWLFTFVFLFAGIGLFLLVWFFSTLIFEPRIY